MALYHLPTSGVNPTPITGRALCHSTAPLVERAFVAWDLISGAHYLVSPTITQAAGLARVNRTYAFWAGQREAHRAQILSGELPLVPARPKPLLVPAVDDAVILDFVKQVGIDRVLNAAVAAEAAE